MFNLLSYSNPHITHQQRKEFNMIMLGASVQYAAWIKKKNLKKALKESSQKGKELHSKSAQNADYKLVRSWP